MFNEEEKEIYYYILKTTNVLDYIVENMKKI